MPSKKELELFLVYSRCAAKCWVFGIDIIPSTGKLIPTRSKYKFIVGYVVITWMVFISMYSLRRNYVGYKAGLYKSSDAATIALQVNYIFSTFGYCIGTSNFICWGIFRKELANLWNLLYQLPLKDLQHKNVNTQREQRVWKAHKLYIFQTFCGCFLGLIPEYVFSSNQGYPNFVKFGLPVATLYTVILYCIGLGFYVNYCVLFFFIVHDTFKTCKEQIKSNELYMCSFAKYKILILICKNFNGVYSLTIIPTIKYAISLFGMVNFYAAIRTSASIPGINYAYMLMAACCFGCAVVLVNLTSAVWSISGKGIAECNIGKVQQKNKRLYLRKTMKYMSPLRISVGGFYFMEKEAKLTFMQFLVNGNINLLLTFK